MQLLWALVLCTRGLIHRMLGWDLLRGNVRRLLLLLRPGSHILRQRMGGKAIAEG